MAQRFKWPKIYVLGDSLTQFSFSKDGGWAAILANEFQRRADVVVRGFSGYNTRQCKALLPYLKSDFQDLSIAGVFLGANDANDLKINPQQGVPLDEYKTNLKDIVQFIKNAAFSNERYMGGTLPMFLISPPPLDEDRLRDMCIVEGRSCGNGAKLVERYATACVETAREIGVLCIDLHTEMLRKDNWKEYLNDGLHFSPKGAEFVAWQLHPILQAFLREGHLGAATEGIMPAWSDVSNTDPDTSFRQWLHGDGSCPDNLRKQPIN